MGGIRTNTDASYVSRGNVMLPPIVTGAVAAPGSIAVTFDAAVPAGAQVAVDGTPVAAPYRVDNLEPRVHELTVKVPGRDPITVPVQVVSGRVATVPVSLAVGTIDVDANIPGTTVLVDGAEVGTVPYQRTDAPVGAHRVTLQAPGYATVETPCLVSVTSPCKVRAELVPGTIDGTVVQPWPSWMKWTLGAVAVLAVGGAAVWLYGDSLEAAGGGPYLSKPDDDEDEDDEPEDNPAPRRRRRRHAK